MSSGRCPTPRTGTIPARIGSGSTTCITSTTSMQPGEGVARAACCALDYRESAGLRRGLGALSALAADRQLDQVVVLGVFPVQRCRAQPRGPGALLARAA